MIEQLTDPGLKNTEIIGNVWEDLYLLGENNEIIHN